MKDKFLRPILFFTFALMIAMTACQAIAPSTPDAHNEEEPHVEEPGTMDQPDNGFPDLPALPNDSGIEGVQTFPSKSEYHNHVPAVQPPEGNIPPPFGEHLNAWQNCGIYDEPVELGNVLHSLEHGAVWLTYAPDLDSSQVAELQNLVRGHGFVLLSPYPPQTDPVVLTGWGVQLVIESLPDDRIEKFIAYYENGPQNPEPGAPCSGAIGNPLP